MSEQVDVVFSRFGVTVTVVEAAGRLLPAEEPEASGLIHQVLVDEGVAVHTGTRVTRVEHDAEGFAVHLGSDVSIRAEQALVATGRRVQLAGLDVDTVGLDPASSHVEVDDRMRAGDGLWAVGM